MISNYWRFMFALPAFLAIIQTALLLTLYKYETPQFLIVNQNNEDGAKEVLGKIYFEEDIPKIVQYIKLNNKEITGGAAAENFSVKNVAGAMNEAKKFKDYAMQANIFTNSTFKDALCDPKYSKATWVGFCKFICLINV